MTSHPPEWVFDDEFDGGESGCGELLIDLRLHFRPLPSGTRVLVKARDAAAPTEMPTWCRLTGHRLVEAEHPHYLVVRK